MAKKTAPEAEEPITQTVQPAQDLRAPDLWIGEMIHVTVRSGVVLRNAETGLAFVPGEATPQWVTPTTLRRLADGDLQRVPAP